MQLQLVRDSIAEPLSLAEAKLHLRVDVTDDDALITACITAARMHAEMLTRRSFISQAWKLVIDSFPGAAMTGVVWGKTWTLPGNAIILERSQVIAVSSINYLDMSGNRQTMPTTDYFVDYGSQPCRITPVFGKIWPIPMPQIGSVEVDFTSGYAAPILANTSNSTIAVQGNWKTYAVGDVVRFSNTGGYLPIPLQPLTDYYIQSVVSPGVYTLSTTSGGTPITLTYAGEGTSFIGVVPEGIKSWMKIRIGSLYQHREEILIAERSGKIQDLPYVDRLLDPYKVMF